jgi:D-hexose-6-phosphate mutarotase
MKKGDEKMTTALFCAIVAVTNAMGTVAVDTHGARVVSYVPVGGEEVWMSQR